jgi:hypothetical protein
MDKTYTDIFTVSDGWTKSHNSADELLGEIQRKNSDSVYSCILDASLLNTLKILEIEAGAAIPVTVEDMRNDEESNYDFEVISLNFKLKKTFKGTVTNLTPDQKNKEKIKGRLTITAFGKPAIRCYLNLDLGTQSFILPKTKSSTEGVQAVIKYQEGKDWPFNASKLCGGINNGNIQYPHFRFPEIKHVADDGFDEVTLQFGTLAISFPFNGKLWTDFQSSLTSYRLRINIPQFSEFNFPAMYKLELWKSDTTRIVLNTDYLCNFFSKKVLVSIERDTTSVVPATWFRPQGTRYEVSIQHNEMMLHGFRDFERGTSAEFALEDVWKFKDRNEKYEANTFFNMNNRWRINHIQVEEKSLLALNKEILDGEVLFDWSPFSAEHDLDEDQWRRLVPATLSYCWVQVSIQRVGNVAVQISPAMLKKYKFIPSGSKVKIKLQVALQKGFSDMGKSGYLDIRCADIGVDIKERSATEVVCRRLRIDHIEPMNSSKGTPMLKVMFSDPNCKSTTVKEYIRPVSYLKALESLDVSDKFCRVTAFQFNDTVHVKNIDLIEM